MKYFYCCLITLVLVVSGHGQTCPKGSHPVYFPAASQVQIIACIQDEVGIGKQSVFWGAKNLTQDKLQIKFTKVVYTKCGNVMRSPGDTYLDPGEFVGGTTFSGELTFETQVWKDDCNLSKNRIDRVSYEDLVVVNISQQEREREKKRIEEEQKRRQEEQRKLEEEHKRYEAERKRVEEERKKQEAEEKAKKSKETENKDKKKEGTKSNASSTQATIYVETPEQAKEREHLEALRRANNAEDQAMTGALGGVLAVGGVLAYNSMDGEWGEDQSFRLRGSLGAGIQNIPFTANYYGKDMQKISESSSTLPVYVGLGVLADFMGDRVVGFGVNPFMNYGMMAFSDSTGSMTNYGGNMYVKFGMDLQLRLKGGYEIRKGDEEYDASNLATYGVVGTEGGSKGEYDYSTLKYGGSLKYLGFELSAYKENVSFLKDIPADIYSYELTIDADFFRMWINYAPNYPIAGSVTYPNTYKKVKQDYFQIGMAWVFGVAKSD